MNTWLSQLDALLRKRGTEQSESPIRVRRRVALALVLALGGTYGFFMGWYAIKANGIDGLAQLASATLKTPLLFLLTLGITFPSLYVFNTLLGSRLTFRETTRILAGWLVVMLAVAASVGPILGFFTISTESYPFMVLLNVVLLGLAGATGCSFLLRVLRQAGQCPSTDEPGEGGNGLTQPMDVSRRSLLVWVVLFGVVGLQMAWVLRPFIGAPGQDFVILRPTDSHVFAALGGVIEQLMGID